MAGPKQKNKKSKQPPSLPAHPQIQEIDNLQDFRTYTGIADLPGVPLVQQIEHLQKEAARRRSDLDKTKKDAKDSTKGKNAAYTTYSKTGAKPPPAPAPVASRYRRPVAAAAARSKILLKDSDGEEESGSSGDEFEEEEVEIEQPDGTRITRMRVKRTPKQPAPASSSSDDTEEEGQIFFAILDYTQFLIPLLSAHIILDILVNIQYSQDITWDNVALQSEILKRAALMAPVLLVMHLFFDPWKDTRVFRVASFVAAVGIGAHLVYIANEEGYYFVMRRAPPLGTIWIWLVIIMHWAYAAVSLVVVYFWMKLRGYTF